MKKVFFSLLNILAAVFAIITLCTINIEFPSGNIISIVNAPVYEKTEDFYNEVNKQITNLFNYISLKNSFETNGRLSYDKIIAETIDINGIKKWSIENCLSNAKKHGLFLDTDGIVKHDETNKNPYTQNDILTFMLKTYPANIRNGVTTEEEFISEVLEKLSTYNTCKALYSNTECNFKYNLSFYDKINGKDIIYKNSNDGSNSYLNSKSFLYINNKDNIISSNINYVNSSIIKSLASISPHPDKEYTLYYSINTDFPYYDVYKEASSTYNNIKSKCGALITASIISIFAFIATLFFALYFILSSEKNVDESKKLFFVFPTELHILLYLLSNVILVLITNHLLNKYSTINMQLSSIRAYLYILIAYITTMTFFTILSIKYTNDTLSPIIFKINKPSNDSILKFSPFTLFLLILLPVIIFFIISFYIIYLYTALGNRLLLLIGVLLLISTIGFMVYLYLLYHAFNKTLKAQTDANNMRSSLIANVTHDIKTPLTSILSYTGLITDEIKKPSKMFKKNVTHYSRIVNDKTNRLNDLINDLIFDSKVSTGGLDLNMQKLNLTAFLEQVTAEFKDRLLTKGIKIIFTHDKKATQIMADSNQLYRVFQNLYSNIYKYALEKSRVYMDLVNEKNRVKVTIRNIQKEKLEVDVNSLKDRFVRGNLARESEGFGLGLSIAENLVKSMGGKLDIKNVRDEFIVLVTFVSHEA